MYKPAARSSCSFKTIQVARWLPHSIVLFYPMGSPRKMYLSSTVHAKVAIFSTQLLNLKKCIFPKFKNWAGMPTSYIERVILSFVDFQRPK